MFLRPDLRGTGLATRQSFTSSQQSESPDSTYMNNTQPSGGWDDAMA